MPQSLPVRLPSPAADLEDQPNDPCDLCKATSKGRNIILCFDGTSNQFGQNNTNVVELYSRIIKDKTQLTYYNSGIGTYARPSWRSFKYLKQVVSNKIDLAIAWNFERIVLAGYRWLSEHYIPGDKIFLFGFSRGAYQVRTLAGMILKVGLILPGNEEQIPFAYELFADLGRRANRSRKRSSDSEEGTSSAEKRESGYEKMAERFKDTFSRKDVKVHFLAAWDTVSSIGFIRGKSLPYTNEFNDDICLFRHALALDERRVKFLPEYICGGESYICEDGAKKGGVDVVSLPGPHVKEVWFAGCHADIGGGNQPNEKLNNAAVPVLWMGNEAFLAGLRLEQSRLGKMRIWDWEKLKDTKPRESLGFIWWPLEILPFRRLSYIDKQRTIWWPHVGKARIIKPGQKIHASVAFIQNYQPRAKFSGDVKGGDWFRILTIGRADGLSWTENIKDLLELDLFDYSRAPIMIKDIRENMKNTESIKVLELFASTPEGWQAIVTAADFSLFAKMASETDKYTMGVGKKMLDRLVRHVKPQMPAVPKSIPSQMDETPRVRIVLVGRSGVGKSSLVRSIFNIDVDKVDIRHDWAGDADIEREYTSSTNPRLILHDSKGFEAGTKFNLDVVEKFLNIRSQYDLLGRIHAIWLCVETPRTGTRLLQTGDERLLSVAKKLNIPIIAVFTKYDLLVTQFLRQDHKPGESKQNRDADAAKKASDFFDRSVKDLQEWAIPCVKVSTTDINARQMLINLTNETFRRLNEIENKIQVLWVAAQQVNARQKVEVSISEGFKKHWRHLDQSSEFEGQILIDCIHRIHDDIVKVWNFNDPTKILSGIDFFTQMIGLVKPLIDNQVNQNLLPTEPVPGFGGMSATVLVALLEKFGFKLGAIQYLFDKYQQSPSTAKILAIYTINLILILHGVFTDALLQSSPRVLSNDLVVNVLRRHSADLRNQALDDIDFATNPQQAIDNVIRNRLGLLDE